MTLPAAVSLGFEAKSYYCAAGSGSTPVWVEIPEVENETVNISPTKENMAPRGNGGWGAVIRALRNGSVTFEVPHVIGNVHVQFLIDLDASGDLCGFAFSDEDIATSGANFFMGDFIVTDHQLKRDSTGAQKDQFTIEPTWPNTAPPQQGKTT